MERGNNAERHSAHVLPTETPSGANGRRPNGQFERGNLVALKTGERSRQQFDLQATERRDLSDAILKQLGHTDMSAAPETLKRFVDGTTQAVLLRDSAFLRVIESGGAITSNGRQRAAYAVWLKARNAAAADLETLGLRAEPKPVSNIAEAAARLHDAKDVNP
jgi:hypothetical protein